MHCRQWINPSTEANLSHLSISYSGPPSASSTSGAAAGGADASAPDSPNGFLSALVDRLRADNSHPRRAETTAEAPSAAASVDSLASVNLDMADQPALPSKTVALFGQLTKAMKSIAAELDAGQKPTDDELKKLGNMADTLASLIAPAPQTTTATPDVPDPSTTMDPLKALAAADTDPAPDLPGTSDPKPASEGAASDQLSQLLASMGITLPATSSTTTSPTDTVSGTSTAGTQPLTAVGQLANRLAELSAAVRPLASDVAQQLDALTRKLAAAELDPKLLAQLTGATDSDGAALDKLVQQLLGDKSVTAPTSTTPQLASNTRLDLPAAITPKAAAVTTPDQPLAPQPSDSIAPKLALKVTTSDTTADATPVDKSKADTDVKATAAAIADSTRSDPTAQPQAGSTTTPVTSNTAAKAIPAAYQAASNPINMGQVAFEMARQLHQGQSRFTIRIDPPELGRVDVKMHVDAAGNVNARLTVERAETLDMFQRDRSSLEKALTQAGLDAGKTNLEFSLRQNPFAGMTGGDQRQQQASGYTNARLSTGDDDAANAPSISLYRGTASAGGVNIFA